MLEKIAIENTAMEIAACERMLTDGAGSNEKTCGDKGF